MTSKNMLALAASCGALLLATPALAQSDDLPFDGLYVGGGGGFDFQPNDVNEQISFDRNLDGTFGDVVFTSAAGNPNAFAPSAAQPGAGFCNGQARRATSSRGCVNDRDSYAYSGRIGFDKQVGNIVVGVVGEFGDSNIRDAVSAFSTTPANYVMNRRVKYTANARLRAGYAVNNTLFYGTAGGVYTRVNNSFFTSNTTNTFTSNGDHNSYGVTGGGGLEQKLTPKISFGLEYLFNRVKDDDYRVRATGGAATGPFLLGGAGGTDFKRNFDYFRWHSARAFVNFRF